jgi:hypothetical protein
MRAAIRDSRTFQGRGEGDETEKEAEIDHVAKEIESEKIRT